VVPAWRERHRRDVRSAAGNAGNRVGGCEIRYFSHESEDKQPPADSAELANRVRRYAALSATLLSAIATASGAGITMVFIGSRECGWTCASKVSKGVVDERGRSPRFGAVDAVVAVEVEAFDHVHIGQWLKRCRHTNISGVHRRRRA
jgi:hypothetical protein